jgi:thioredoxin
MMKKLIPILLITIAALPGVSCNSQPKAENTKAAVALSEKTETGVVTIEHLTPVTFKSKVFDYESKAYKFAGDKPCIIDFYASWCGPCKVMAPTLQSIANEYKGKINVYKVDVEAQKELASAFGISGIPTILFCPKSEKPQMTSGLLSKTDFDQAIKEVLLK